MRYGNSDTTGLRNVHSGTNLVDATRVCIPNCIGGRKGDGALLVVADGMQDRLSFTSNASFWLVFPESWEHEVADPEIVPRDPKADIALTAGESKRLRNPADGASASKSQTHFQNICTRPGRADKKTKYLNAQASDTLSPGPIPNHHSLLLACLERQKEPLRAIFKSPFSD